MFKEFENVSIIDAIYWVMATITTVGYGDITPTHAITKLLACFFDGHRCCHNGLHQRCHHISCYHTK